MQRERITISYDDRIRVTESTKKHIQRAELCQRSISSGRPFNEKKIMQISDFFRTTTTWSSCAVEGCTFSIGETKTLLEYGITIQGKSLKETLEVSDHANAFDYMMELVKNGAVLKEDDIKKLHELLYATADPKIAGKYKVEQNFISGSNYTTIPPKQIAEEMKKLERWIEDTTGKLHPIVQAAELHKKITYIHPFADGNGRCARLCMNVVLIQNGYLPCQISPAMRLDYINALESDRSNKTDYFIRFIAEAETETEKDFMRALDISMPKLPSPDCEPEVY